PVSVWITCPKKVIWQLLLRRVPVALVVVPPPPLHAKLPAAAAVPLPEKVELLHPQLGQLAVGDGAAPCTVSVKTVRAGPPPGRAPVVGPGYEMYSVVDAPAAMVCRPVGEPKSHG